MRMNYFSFSDAPIKFKLTIFALVTTFVALLLMGTGFLAKDFYLRWNSINNNLSIKAKVTGAGVRTAILFHDHEYAEKLLVSYKQDLSLVSAAIYTENGDLFASYYRDSSIKKVPTLMEKPNQRYEEGHLILFKEIIFDDEVVGTIFLRSDLDELFEDFFLNLLITLGVILISAFSSILVGRRFLETTAKPIMHLANTVETMTIENNFSTRFQEYGKDEIGTLIHGFNNMLNQIEDRDLRLAEYSRDLEDQVKERVKELETMIETQKHTEERLIEAKEKAEEMNKAKSVFLSSMSHELRTPLNAILGFSQLLHADPENNLSEDQQSEVDYILESGRLLLNLIDEILDLSRIEAGKVNISMEAVPLYSIIQEVYALMEHLLTANQITIEIKEEFQNRYINADYRAFKQVLMNLISNAIKYNRVGGKVTLSCTEIGSKKWRISVIDTGHGIDPENFDKLFEPFNRLGAEALEIQGSGIGLTITKRLVSMMKGEIFVESELGKGTHFYVEFQQMDSPEPAREEEKAPFPSTMILTEEVQKIEKKLLYIEDNPANLKLVKHILKRRPDIVFLEARAGDPGIEIAKTHIPDLILLDINLPGKDGYEILKEITAEDSLKQIPCFAVTANAMPKDIEKGKKLGFKEYITKPINIAKMLQIVDQVLSKKI